MPIRADKIIAIKPITDTSNSFVRLFSGAIAAQGYQVRAFDWDKIGKAPTDAIILHWPYELLGWGSVRGMARWFRLSRKLAQARKRGTSIIWVAHNARPHDGGRLASRLMRHFIRSIDGIIHLSHHSHALIEELYSPADGVRQVDTVHGHYLDVMETPFVAPPQIAGAVRLAYFGQIRAYKNVETLARLVAAMPTEAELSISGLKSHANVADELETIAAGAKHIVLNILNEPLPDAELERVVDEANAVVLPYQAVLNSGAAIFALSRARPVLAPNTGSLPELQAAVGTDWLQLYDGAIDRDVLSGFVKWVRERPNLERPDLSSLAWNRVGSDIVTLLDRMFS